MSLKTQICLFLITWTVLGHSQNHTYRQYTTDDGLPTNYVYGVIEDNEGYIWAYTENGLAKFDGEQFRNFTIADGLPSNDVFYFVKDDTTGLLWMCTTANIPAYIENDSIVVLDQIQKKVTYLIKNKGKIRYHSSNRYFVENKTLVIDSLLSKEQMRLWFPKKAQEKNLVAVYRKGNIIYGSSGWSTYPASSWFKFDFQKKTLQEFTFPGLRKIPSQEVLYHGTFELAQPFYMVITSTELHLVNLDTREYYSHDLVNLVGEPIPLPSIDFPDNKTLQINTDKFYIFIDEQFQVKQVFYPKNIADQYTLLHLFIDSQGNYWIGTREGGLFFINKEELKTSYLQPENRRDKVIEKLLWNKGKIYAVNDNFSVFQLSSDDHLQRFYQHSKRPLFNDAIVRPNGDMLLFGGAEPIIFRNNQQQQPIFLPVYAPFRKLPKISPQHHALSYLSNVKKISWNEKYQQLFFATHGGLFWYDIPSSNFRQIGEKRHDWNIHTDTFNHITYITNQEGIYTFKKGQLQQERESVGLVTTMRAKDAQSLWLGTQNNGLLEWNRSSNEIQQISKRKYISAIWKDADQYLLATREGVVVIKEEKGDYSETYCYDKKDGLLTAEILDVLADSQFIYAATIKGIMKIKKDHEPLVINDTLNRLTINAVAVNGATTSETDLLQLKRRENEVLIHYHLLDFASKGNIQYQYRLAPLQNDWTSTEAKQVRFDELPPNEYTFYLKATDWYGNEYVLKQPLVFCIQKAFWQTWWFQLLLLVLFLSIIALVIKRREALQAQKLAQEKALNQKIADLQLQSLRAQMNPHFIFNALGSIQYFIQTHRTDEADNYLTMFARLMRKYLDSATERIVDLQTEVAMLEEYTQLEMMRFEGQFTTEISVHEVLDPEEAVIPSMLLQPFVENAINHGLQPRTEAGGRLLIDFSKDENGALVCTISDNGIGRENAAKYRKKAHVSRGMQNVYNRIKTLRANALSDINIHVEDLYADEKNYPGTKVEIVFKKMVL